MGIEYGWFSFALSLLMVGLGLRHLASATGSYRRFHDDRAAVALAKAVSLTVIALGLAVSGLGVVVEVQELGVTGLAIARGAMLVVLVVLVATDAHGMRDEERKP